jgi:hypothetical protein
VNVGQHRNAQAVADVGDKLIHDTRVEHVGGRTAKTLLRAVENFGWQQGLDGEAEDVFAGVILDFPSLWKMHCELD